MTAGIDSKNEYLKAKSRLMPKSNMTAMVKPLREIAGIMDIPCITPIRSAVGMLIVSLRSVENLDAKSTMPLAMNPASQHWEAAKVYVKVVAD